MAAQPHPSGRRGFFRTLRDWAVEETRAAAKPILEDYLERAEPLLTALAGPEVLRPPGAIEERLFRQTCTGCGKCVEACPQNSIVLAEAGTFPEIAGTSVIVPRRRPCFWCERLVCQEACPSGALQPISRLAMRLGTARVLPALCHAHLGRVCTACVVTCPLRGKAIEMRRGLPLVHPDVCTGCGLCEYACPSQPAAIRVFSGR